MQKVEDFYSVYYDKVEALVKCFIVSVMEDLSPGFHRCASGQVIPVEKLCDFKHDCVDHSDETATLCGETTVKLI